MYDIEEAINGAVPKLRTARVVTHINRVYLLIEDDLVEIGGGESYLWAKAIARALQSLPEGQQ